MEDQNNIRKASSTKLQRVNQSLKKHPFVVVLILILVITFIWFSAKLNNERNRFEKSKNELITKYESQIDSIYVQKIEFASLIFSWSVRSEMLRNNMENLSQLFNVFVREAGARLVQLVNTQDNKIIISTDKRFEGENFEIPRNISLDSSTTITDSLKTTVYTPIMDFNKKIGLLIVEMQKER